METSHDQLVESGWRLEVGLVITGVGLLHLWLVGGVIMPLWFGQLKGFLRLSSFHCYLILNVAAMLWQVMMMA